MACSMISHVKSFDSAPQPSSAFVVKQMIAAFESTPQNGTYEMSVDQ